MIRNKRTETIPLLGPIPSRPASMAGIKRSVRRDGVRGPLIFSFLLTLSFAASAMSQDGRTFYNVCESNSQPYVDFHRDTVVVKTLTDDLIEFESVATPYTAKRIPNSDLLAGGRDVHYFYAIKVDADSFILMQKGLKQGFTYFHADKRKVNEPDSQKRCSVDDLKRLEAAVDNLQLQEEEASKQKKRDFDGQSKAVITEFVRGLRSQRADPALEMDVRKWWKSSSPTEPLLRTVFLQSAYEITRNDLGIVLRKTVDAIIIVKNPNTQKCFMQWRSFGYESLGGAAFDTEIKGWMKQDRAGFGYYNRFITAPGDRKLIAGNWYEVDCTPFART